jgi:hypothetical protein
MSSAKKDEYKFSSCLHVRKFIFGFFDRAAFYSRPCEARKFCTTDVRGIGKGEVDNGRKEIHSYCGRVKEIRRRTVLSEK